MFVLKFRARDESENNNSRSKKTAACWTDAYERMMEEAGTSEVRVAIAISARNKLCNGFLYTLICIQMSFYLILRLH